MITIPYRVFLLNFKRPKLIISAILLIILIQFLIFKYFYPYASFIHDDSFVYLETARKNLGINTYLIGYSVFLRVFSVFSSSDTALVAFQYVALHASSLFLLTTIFYLYRPRRIFQNILLFFSIINPLFLFLGNLVSSDALFLALSLTWFSLLLWIISLQSIKLIIWHAVVIYISFTFRYNAIIYIPISAFAILLSRQNLKWKIIGILIPTFMVGFFIADTGNKYKALTGHWQYSPFSGWQIANNAMYAYRYVDSDSRKPVPAQFQILDKMIREYFDTTRDIYRFPQEGELASTAYMWTPDFPLWKYTEKVFSKDTISKTFKKWSTMGPFFKEYGIYIISHYPREYAQFFLWPNANKYYAPPVEFLNKYNSGSDSVTAKTKEWFRYSSRRVVTRTKDLRVNMLDYYPILSGIVNALMLFLLLSRLILRRTKIESNLKNGIFLAEIVWVINAVFTIFASSAALRFQAFPILLTMAFVCIELNWLISMANSPDVKYKMAKIPNAI